MVICGVMTGTSLDGIDIAICEFNQIQNKIKFELIWNGHYYFSNQLRNLLLETVSNQHIDLKTLSQLNIAYTNEIAIAIVDAKKKSETNDIEAVGLHGQTLWHNPEKEKFCGQDVASTFQLGSGTHLATIQNTKVVYDFRTADIALGGQGAPLVPFFDYNFLKSDYEDVIALNIGGISNITFLPKNCSANEVIAFDCGPGNCLIDICAQKLFGVDFDENGYLASQGEIVSEIFDELISIKYIKQKPPKSTGKELFNVNLIEKYFGNYSKNDIIRTVTEFTVYGIAENIRLFANPLSKIIVSGGGANNNFLISTLRKRLNCPAIIPIDDIGIPSSAKEAIAFAFLAYCKLLGIESNLPSVTGASRAIPLGAIAEH
ncbi:MAG: anhydro-N-acetylmuramic acid kinase [Ignavibacteria bacterium]|nr:anhydro-N-acetylmuramic acid kinase [Ignavibacteria bacterium]